MEVNATWSLSLTQEQDTFSLAAGDSGREGMRGNNLEGQVYLLLEFTSLSPFL